MTSRTTIYAVSSGSLPSGVAVVRLSGAQVSQFLNSAVGRVPQERKASLFSIQHPQTGEKLDEALVVFFKGPHSFTGEDVAELHCHGGFATVNAVLDMLSVQEGFQPAEPGEFSRRAFENGKLDLTALEGLSDLISAQTDQQRKQALSQSTGQLRVLYDGWRSQLIRFRALIEAEFDFADEDDVPGSVSQSVWKGVRALLSQIQGHLDDQHRGELIRDGFKVVLAGPTNAGKSSLLNALAKRDVAIVTAQPGTTRDVITVQLDLDGYLVVISDTAGIRDARDLVEQEGIRRAKEAADKADLVFWLQPADQPLTKPDYESAKIVVSKSDLASFDPIPADALKISILADTGLEDLINFTVDQIRSKASQSDGAVMTRKRHRQALIQTTESLESSLMDGKPLELRAEDLRLAADALGRITGRIDVEDLLDVIFSEFCIGK